MFKEVIGATVGDDFVLDKFIAAVVADGGTADKNALYISWNRQKALLHDKATAILMPGAYKTGYVYFMKPDGSFIRADFSRATASSRINKDGMLEVVAANIPAVHYNYETGVPFIYLDAANTNLIANNVAYTGTFNSNSSASAVPAVYAGATVRKYDRAVAADEISYQRTGISVTGHCYAMYVKRVDTDIATIFMRFYDAGNNLTGWVKVSFNFATKAVTTTTSQGGMSLGASYWPAANGWYRIHVIWNAVLFSYNRMEAGIGSTFSDQPLGTSVLCALPMLCATALISNTIITTGSTATRSADTITLGSVTSPTLESLGLVSATDACIAYRGTALFGVELRGASNALQYTIIATGATGSAGGGGVLRSGAAPSGQLADDVVAIGLRVGSNDVFTSKSITTGLPLQNTGSVPNTAKDWRKLTVDGPVNTMMLSYLALFNTRLTNTELSKLI